MNNQKRTLTVEETLSHFGIKFPDYAIHHVLVDDNGLIVEVCDNAHSAAEGMDEEGELTWNTLLTAKEVDADYLLDTPERDYAQLAVDLDDIVPFARNNGIDVKKSLMCLTV